MVDQHSVLASTERKKLSQIVEHSSDNETELGSSQKVGGSAEQLIAGGEKHMSVEP